MITIIIVNWNAGHQLHDCIISISHYHHNLVEQVIIVDNASTDNSLSLVEALANLPFNLKIIKNKQNRGFAAACNKGAVLANTKYLLFLNPDTLLYENSLLKSYHFMEVPENRQVGVVGIQLIDERGEISRSCARFSTLKMFLAQTFGVDRLPKLKHLNTHMTEWEHNETRKVDHVIGAFYLIRKKIFDDTHGFDERFFVYLEDLDLSLNVAKAGFSSIYLAEAQAFHAGGGTSRNVKATRLFYSLRSRILYGFKHFSMTNALLLFFITLLLEPISRLALSITRNSLSDAKNTVHGYAMLFKDLPNIIRVASKSKK